MRELDPKLLFACVAAEREFAGIKGALGPGEGDKRREALKNNLQRRKVLLPTSLSRHFLDSCHYRFGLSFAYHLDKNIPSPASVVEIDKDDLLPRPQNQIPIGNRNG